MSNKITLEEVAKKAGVSKTTVSRFINNKHQFMSSETRFRIENSIKELGYISGPIRNKTKQVAIITENLASSFSSSFIGGIVDSFDGLEYCLNVLPPKLSYESEIELLKRVNNMKLYGIIASLNFVSGKEARSIITSNIPIIFSGRNNSIDNFDAVLTDSYRNVDYLEEYIIKNNIKQIATVNLKPSSDFIIVKSLMKLIRNRFDFLADDNIHTFENKDDLVVENVINETLEKNKGKIALIVYDSLLLPDFIRAIQKNEKALRRIFIVGFEKMYDFALPKVNGMLFDERGYEIGSESAKILHQRMSHKGNTDIRIVKTVKSNMINLSSTDKSSVSNGLAFYSPAAKY